MLQKKKDSSENIRNPRLMVWKFVLTYVLLMGVFLLLLALEPVKRMIDINGLYTNMIVYLLALVLAPFDLIQEISGSIIRIRHMSLDVKFGCNGLEAFLIYAVAIISFPSSYWQKLLGIGIGFVGLQAFNILRIAGLVICGVYFKALFKYVHIYIAQGVMIAIALTFFLIWLNYVTKKQNPA